MGSKLYVISDGQIIKNLKIIKEVEKRWNLRRFLVQCIKCWAEKEVFMSSFQKMKTWCNCVRGNRWRKIKVRKLLEKRLNTIYYGIYNRCNSVYNPKFYNYWWRWIKCEWKSFQEFYNDMSLTYRDDLTIERIDNNWNYCKENCRWANRFDQNNNRRNNIILQTWETVAQWSRNMWYEKKYNSYIYKYHREWFSLNDIRIKLDIIHK